MVIDAGFESEILIKYAEMAEEVACKNHAELTQQICLDRSDLENIEEVVASRLENNLAWSIYKRRNNSLSVAITNRSLALMAQLSINLSPEFVGNVDKIFENYERLYSVPYMVKEGGDVEEGKIFASAEMDGGLREIDHRIIELLKESGSREQELSVEQVWETVRGESSESQSGINILNSVIQVIDSEPTSFKNQLTIALVASFTATIGVEFGKHVVKNADTASPNSQPEGLGELDITSKPEWTGQNCRIVPIDTQHRYIKEGLEYISDSRPNINTGIGGESALTPSSWDFIKQEYGVPQARVDKLKILWDPYSYKYVQEGRLLYSERNTAETQGILPEWGAFQVSIEGDYKGKTWVTYGQPYDESDDPLEQTLPSRGREGWWGMYWEEPQGDQPMIVYVPVTDEDRPRDVEWYWD